MLMSEFKMAIKGYIYDTSADVDQVAADALRHLSNFFYLEDEDESLVGDGIDTVFVKPDGTLFVYGIKCAGEEYERIDLSERDRFEVAEENGLLRYYETATQLVFLAAPGDGDAITIHRRKAFSVPADAVALDVPDHLIPLALAMACQRYFRRMLSMVAIARETLPDIKPNEIRTALKEWTDQVNEEIKSIKNSL